MVESILGISRRLLQSVDIRITRRRFKQSYFTPPPDTERLRRLTRFLCSLDLNGSTGYVHTHLDRLARTLAMVPPPGETSRILELGCYMQMTPALRLELGYREVRGAYFGTAGHSDWKTVSAGGRQIFGCRVDLFDAERDRFPYRDGHFDGVLACEIVEHLRHDPMHLLI
ncbi:MAG: hypothetical protein GY953_00015, partial [bacterium]|nr:hypothetical protein [bacterium]